MHNVKLFLTFSIFAWISLAEAKQINYGARSDVTAFIDEMTTLGFDSRQLQKTFADAQYKQSIIDAISRPAEHRLTWKEYQDIFLTESRVKQGSDFIHKHQDVLDTAQKRYGVPVTIVAAIIGVETFYGRIKGNYRVIDSLSTLAFDYAPRAKFFREELKQFLLLVREEGQEIGELLGSYAGAMGYGQFISSSYRNYAVDFDNDGVRDIWHNPSDAIGSVANYMAQHGWQPSEKIALTAMISEQTKVEFNRGLKPNRTVAELLELGISASETLHEETLVSPILLNGKQGKEYWFGLQNFYVISRYNHSRLYVMAVFQLSEHLKLELAN